MIFLLNEGRIKVNEPVVEGTALGARAVPLSARAAA
jgi:hypothetical protein